MRLYQRHSVTDERWYFEESRDSDRKHSEHVYVCISGSDRS